MSENSEEKEAIQTKNPIEYIQLIVAIVAVFSIVSLATGFLVVHSHIAKYTDLHVFELNKNIYTVGGVIVFVYLFTSYLSMSFGFLILRLFFRQVDKIPNKTLSGCLPAIIILGILSILFFVNRELFWLYVWLILGMFFVLTLLTLLLFWSSDFVTDDEINDKNESNKDESDKKKIDKIDVFVDKIGRLSEVVNFMRNHPFDLASLTIAAIIILATYFFLEGFAVNMYGGYPSTKGGGNPSTVNLIFYEPDDVELFNLPRKTDNETGLLCLLIETNDSYLIYNPYEKKSILVPKNRVAAIEDTFFNIDEETNFVGCFSP